MIILLIFGLIILIILAVILSYFFLIPFLFGAPYDISRRESLSNMVKFTNPKRGDKIAELGSGDGRVCIALAQTGAEVYGFEINPFLVWLSRRKIRKLGLQNKIFIYWKSFWKVNLNKYNKVVFFQFKTITNKLGKKFKKELKPGSKIISHQWKLPEWPIKKKIGKFHFSYGAVYLYEV